MKTFSQKINDDKNLKIIFFYIFFAGIATIVDISLLLILTEKFKIYYLLSACISYSAGMITNYGFNKYFTFENRSRRIAQQFGLFIFVALIGLALNQLIIWSLVEFFGIWYILAKIISIFVVMLWSFFGHKKITFGIIKN